MWAGICSSSRFAIKLDTARLNPTQEIAALTAGIATYEAHRSATSFEVTRRTAVRMAVAQPVVLATHTCRGIEAFGQVAPDYFDRAKLSTDESEVPF